MRAVALLALVILLAAGCVGLDAPAPGTAPPTSTTPGPEPDPEPPTPTELGPLAFDGERAFDLVREQVLYPNGTVRTRIPGTPGNVEVANWMSDEMHAMGYSVDWHHFNATYGCERTPMHNVIAERAGTSGRIVVFAAHYDTRPIADKDPDPAKRDQPIAGANDGGSGVAVLLELARVLAPSDDTVRFVFFDGEDGGGYKGKECTDWILGSRAYAEHLPPADLDRIEAFILVDMVGDPHLRLPYEGYSRSTLPGRALQDRVHGVAHGLGHDQFINETGYSIIDDHVPFVEAHVPAIDLIHTLPMGSGRVFPDWHHTVHDDLDSVSAESLHAVGQTLEEWFRARERGLAASVG